MTSPGTEPPAPPAGGAPGAGLRKASWWGTGVFAATAVAAALAQGPSGPLSGAQGPSGPLSGAPGPSGPLSGVPGLLAAVAFAVAVGLFLAGCVLFLVAYARGVARSRSEEVAVTTLYVLAGSVPRGVRQSLLGSLAAEVVVALGTAIARPYSSLAAGALVPMYGLGLCGLWSARHGTFPPRQPGGQRPDPGPGTEGRPHRDPGSVNGP